MEAQKNRTAYGLVAIPLTCENIEKFQDMLDVATGVVAEENMLAVAVIYQYPAEGIECEGDVNIMLVCGSADDAEEHVKRYMEKGFSLPLETENSIFDKDNML